MYCHLNRTKITDTLLISKLTKPDQWYAVVSLYKPDILPHAYPGNYLNDYNCEFR